MKRLDKYIKESILDTTIDTNALLGVFKDGVVTNDLAYKVFGYDDVEEITLPEGITELGFQAFARRNSIRRIVLPSTLEVIGEQAFVMCKNLKEVVFHPKTKNLRKICEVAFASCTSLTELDLPDCIISIRYNAFGGTGITDLRVPSNLQVSHGSFHSMEHLKSLDLSHIEFTSAPSELCEFCSSLEEVTLPHTCTAISSKAFYCCGNLKVIHAPQVEAIGERAFYKCKKLKTLDMEYDKGLQLDPYAFQDCKTLVDIPVPISTAKRYAFSGCSKLEEITWRGNGFLDKDFNSNDKGKKNPPIIVNVLVPKERLDGMVQKHIRLFGGGAKFVFPDK